MIRSTTLALSIALLTSSCTRSPEASPSGGAPPPPAATEAVLAPAAPAGGADPAPDPAAAPNPTAATPGAAAAHNPTAATPGAAATAPGGAAQSPTTEPTAAGPIPAPVTAAVAMDGEARIPLPFDQPVTVDPPARFQVDVAVPLIDARLSLIDSDDAMIPAAESHEIGATWSRFTLVPDGPLRPGSTYSLRLDGAADREAHDPDGRSYQITTWKIRTSGEPPPPEKPTARSKRRR